MGVVGVGQNTTVYQLRLCCSDAVRSCRTRGKLYFATDQIARKGKCNHSSQRTCMESDGKVLRTAIQTKPLFKAQSAPSMLHN